MSCTEEKPVFKHYCRICKKGFMCGRALGGHMRAHGFGDETGNNNNNNIDDDDDQISDWEDHHHHHHHNNNNNNSSSSSGRRMYQLRTNPNRLKSCKVCENCGKEFLSWKSFLEHGKCNNSDQDAESLVSSPAGSDDVDGVGNGGDEYELDGGGGGSGGGRSNRKSCGQWSKRKRSVRTKVCGGGGGGSSSSFNHNYLSSEDEDLLLAKCLVDLANNVRFENGDDDYYDQPEESCASASREEERRNPALTTFLAPSPSLTATATATRVHNNYKSGSSSKGLFECKACKKVFNSHQALGGHRASHKKVKGCYAAKQDQIINQIVDDNSIHSGGGGGGGGTGADDDVITHDQDYFISSKLGSSSLQYEQGSKLTTTKRKSKVHECTICHRIFSTGQALGGHKRCHWMTSSNAHHHDPIIKNVHQLHDDHHTPTPPPILPTPIPTTTPLNHDDIDKTEGLDLNLNLPAAHQGIEMKRDPQNPLSFEVYTGIRLQIWSNNNNNNNNNDNAEETEAKNSIQNNVGKNCDNGEGDKAKITVEDEADSKVKLEKLSMSGNSSPSWLQVGIGNSTTDVAAGP